MFNGAKQTFGAPVANTAFGFGSANTTASPFGGQSAFGKPVTQGFGQAAPAFGQSAPSAFGQPQQQQQQPGTSLFGVGGVQQQQPSAFGVAATQPSAFGGFGGQPQQQQQQQQLQQSTSLFGAQQQQQPGQSTSLFGQSAGASPFGANVAKAPAFGFGATIGGGNTATQSLFGQPSTSTAATGGMGGGFGAFGAQTAGVGTTVGGGGMFGTGAGATASAFGGGVTSALGVGGGTLPAGSSLVKYQESLGTDTLMKNGQSNNVSTKQHCITAMKEYEAKSFEELRMEDYMANRKGPQPGGIGVGVGVGGGMFGTAATNTANTSLFGASTLNTSGGIFGQPQQQQQPQMNQLGGFGATNTSGMAFGASTSAFGQPQQQQQQQQQAGMGGGLFGGGASTLNTSGGLFGAKPFGQAATPATGGGLFGQPAASAAPAFGQPAAGGVQSGFGAFGQAQPQAAAPLFGNTTGAATGGLFGQPAAGTTTTGGFGGFGSSAATNQPAVGGGLFGQKPAQTGFGGLSTGAFGTTPAATAGGFGSFGQPQAQPQGSLFNSSFNKPAAAPSFGGFGTTAGAAPLGQQPAVGGGLSLFGNTAAKPGGLFGGAATTQQPGQGGLFGSSFGTNSGGMLGGGGGVGIGGTGSLLGQSSMGMGQSFGGFGGIGGGMGGAQQQAAAVPIHQQILSIATSPYGDNPIFRDLRASDGALSENALKPTNPAAQKALLESAGANQFKMSPRIGATGGAGGSAGGGLKVKPIGSAFSRKSLFGGLEEFDSSVEESFSLKPNAKRLIIKPKSVASLTPGASSNAAGGSDFSPARTGIDATSGGQHKRLNLPRSTQAASGRDEADDASFRNEDIRALQATATNETSGGGRRESWLHSNVLEKVSKQSGGTAGSGGAVVTLDNTIQELVGGTDGGNRAKTTEELQKKQQQQQQSARPTKFAAQTSTDSLSVSRSFLDDTMPTNAGDTSLASNQLDASAVSPTASAQPHPCGVTLLRAGYYTIPALDTLVDYLDADGGTCVVPNLTIGRRGYGSVYFDAEIDVYGLNFDELVHFRHKEVIIYPDDENKPPIGCDLNRKAEVTLDQVWPHDKTLREPIKDRDRLDAMDYQGKLRRVCEKHDMRFVDYRPETGSWVFRVDHFSKYGLNDSDDEDDGAVAVDPKKAKLAAVAATTTNGVQPKRAIPSTKPNATTRSPHDPDEITHRSTSSGDVVHRSMDHSNGRDIQQPLSPSSMLAMDMGADSHKLQLMKASFFVDDDAFDGKSVGFSEPLDGRDSPDQTVPHPGFLRHRLGHPTGSSIGSSSHNTIINTNNDPTAAVRSHQHGALIMNTDTKRHKASSMSTVSMAQYGHQHQIAGHSTQFAAGTSAVVAVPTIQKPIGPRSAPLHARPKVAVVRIPRMVIPLGRSMLAQLIGQHVPLDMAFEMGRQYRIGWTAPMVMLTLGTIQSAGGRHPSVPMVANVCAGRAANDQSGAVLMLSRCDTSTGAVASGETTASAAAIVEPHLRLQLRRSTCDAGAALCPRFTANTGGGGTGGNATTMPQATTTHLFAEHLAIARAASQLGDSTEYVTGVWSLCDALWGADEELDDQPPAGHLTQMRRRERLSEWLESVVADDHQARQSKSTYLEHLLDLLHTHRVVEACDLCFNNNDLNLAFVLGQLSGGPAVRQLIQHQLYAWQEVQADGFMAIERLKAYMLAGGVSLIASAHGAINVYEQLDWLRAFALNVWYVSPATASVTDSLLAYERSYLSDEFHAQSPLPPYADPPSVDADGGRPIEDVRFHLLKLYSKRSHPLERLLNPATHTADPMDFRLSWLLMQTLASIGYRHCAELCVAQLHTSFAAQLEREGDWHWAVFVLMHLADDGRRALAVQTLLYKYVRLSATDATEAGQLGEQATDADGSGGEIGSYAERERFLVDELGVPLRWINWAKAVRAGALGRWHAHAEYLLRSGHVSMAHDVIMLHIAPEAIINEQIDYVRRLLQRCLEIASLDDCDQQQSQPQQQQQHRANIPNWANQGGLLLEYIRLGERFDQLLHADNNTASVEFAWQQLQQPLSELCSRLNLFPCPTAKHRLCQSEIAQRLANLVTGMRQSADGTVADFGTCTLMRMILEKLPLPQEYARQKLRKLLEDDRLIDELQMQVEMR